MSRRSRDRAEAKSSWRLNSSESAAAPPPRRPPASELERRIVREGAGASAEKQDMDDLGDIVSRPHVVVVSVAYSLATAIFGGMTPAVCTYLIHATGNPATHDVLAPALEGFSPTPEMPEIGEALELMAAIDANVRSCRGVAASHFE